jgi:polyhydroxyalkanoic acid synthase PhaR subunit
MSHVPQSTDPFAVWRDWVSQSERQWNAFLNNAMATDEFSKTVGQFMDVYVNMQKGMNEAMSRYLSSVNMPSRQDVLGLGDRLTAIEERLTAIEKSLARSTPVKKAEAPAGGPASNGVARPPRTKKPASKS